MTRSSTVGAKPDSDTIERRPLFQQIADRIREMILDGDYEPGQRLQEKELSERFGVSRTPLREALKVLSSEGLITHAPNRGATITQLTDVELAETYPVMGALEGLAGELACQHATDAEINEIAKLHKPTWSMHYGKRARWRTITRSTSAIHAAIFAAARNVSSNASKPMQQLTGRARRAQISRLQCRTTRWAQAVQRTRADSCCAAVAQSQSTRREPCASHTDTKVRDSARGFGVVTQQSARHSYLAGMPPSAGNDDAVGLDLLVAGQDVTGDVNIIEFSGCDR